MTRYRVVMFGKPRGPWRETRAHAMDDAIAAGLASYDPTEREHWLPVPADIVVDYQQPGAPPHPLADA